MSVILTILMWWGIISVTSWIGIVAFVVYDRIKYGPIQVYYDDDEDH